MPVDQFVFLILTAVLVIGLFTISGHLRMITKALEKSNQHAEDIANHLAVVAEMQSYQVK